MLQFYGFDGFNAASPLTTVTANAAAGATQLSVASTAAIAAGDWVRLTTDEPFNQTLFAGANTGTGNAVVNARLMCGAAEAYWLELACRGCGCVCALIVSSCISVCSIDGWS
jgi:hypothetical protein